MTGQLPTDAIQTILATEDRILGAFAMTAAPVNTGALLAILPMTRANVVFTALPSTVLAAALSYSTKVAPGTVEHVAKQLTEWRRRDADTRKAPPIVAPPAAVPTVHEPKLAALELLKASPPPGVNAAAMMLSSKAMAATGARSLTGTVVVPDQGTPDSPVLFTGANYSVDAQNGLRLGFQLRNNEAKPAQGKVYASARYLHRSGQIELIDGRPYPFPFTVKHIAPAAISFLPSVTDGAFVDLLIDVRNLNGESLTHREIEVTGP